MTETLMRCPRCRGLFYSLQSHFCAIPERKDEPVEYAPRVGRVSVTSPVCEGKNHV